VIDVFALCLMMLIAIYAGLVTSIIFRFNQKNVLENNLALAFFLPIFHFIMCPVLTLFYKKADTSIWKRLKTVWFMTVMFPLVLARFTIVLTMIKFVTEKEQIKEYQKVCEREINSLSFAC
jgi:hypothetical protein